jgi:hypothetical protein
MGTEADKVGQPEIPPPPEDGESPRRDRELEELWRKIALKLASTPDDDASKTGA